MPTVFNEDGYRFFFYSNEGNEPCHVHVEGHDGLAKFWLNPYISIVFSANYNSTQLKKLYVMITENRARIEERWNAHFNR